MIPQGVYKFRETYRQTRIPKYYSGILHACFTATVLILPIIYFSSQLENISWKEFLAFPFMLVFGNWVEYMSHRYPLHHSYPGMRKTYQIHTREHHQYYTDQAISFETPRDFILVFFPWWSPVLTVISAFVAAYGIIGPLISPNVGFIVGLMIPGFFLFYELMHFYFHLPDENPLTNIPVLRSIRHLHKVHHNQRFMTHYNFNVTFPLGDWIYGTLYPIPYPLVSPVDQTPSMSSDPSLKQPL
jgi:hypothetical protein